MLVINLTILCSRSLKLKKKEKENMYLQSQTVLKFTMKNSNRNFIATWWFAIPHQFVPKKKKKRKELWTSPSFTSYNGIWFERATKIDGTLDSVRIWMLDNNNFLSAHTEHLYYILYETYEVCTFHSEICVFAYILHFFKNINMILLKYVHHLYISIQIYCSHFYVFTPKQKSGTETFPQPKPTINAWCA